MSWITYNSVRTPCANVSVGAKMLMSGSNTCSWTVEKACDKMPLSRFSKKKESPMNVHPPRLCLVSPLKLYTLLHQIFRYMHGVLNIDKKITNCTYCETIILSLINPWFDNKVLQYTCANDGLIMLNKFVSRFTDGFCNLFFLLVSEHPMQHLRITTNMTPQNFTL